MRRTLFKNLTVYRVGPNWAANSAELEAGLDKMIFVECGPTQPDLCRLGAATWRQARAAR